MGIDLTLLPVDGDLGDWGYAHTMLELDRDYTLHDAILTARPFALETFELHSFRSRIPDGEKEGEYCYGQVYETPYGERLTYLESPALIRAFESVSALGRNSLAALAWLKAYTTDKPCKVALYWH